MMLISWQRRQGAWQSPSRGKGLIEITYMMSCLAGFSISCVRIIQILLVIDVEQLCVPLKILEKAHIRQFLNTSWICAKRVKSIHVHQGALGVGSKEESTTLRWRRQEGQGRVGGEQQGTVATAPSLQHTITQTITTRKWSLAP